MVQSEFPTYLISQLGRNKEIFSHKQLPGDRILQFAFSEIKKAQLIIGGRTMMVECNNTEKLICFYNRNGFRQFQLDSKKSKLVQFIKKIN